MNIPIIIVNWNNWEDTIECLDAVMQQSYRDFSVFLVDNGSDDGSPAILQRAYGNNPAVTLLLNEQNVGFTRANNEVLNNYILPDSRYSFVALLNNDTVPDKDWLQNLIAAASQERADIVSSKMIDYYEPGKMDNAGHLMLNTGEILPIGHGEPVSLYQEGFENMGACAGAGLYATNMLREIGVFDPQFTTGYEDAELGVRAVISRKKCWFAPNAIVKHKMGRSVKKIFNHDYSLSIQKHIFYTFFKVLPAPVILLAVPSILVKYLSAMVIYFISWQPAILKILWQAITGTWKDRKKIIAARKAFLRGRKTLGPINVIKRQTFFLGYDIRRFRKLIIDHAPSTFDKYGKVLEGSEKG